MSSLGDELSLGSINRKVSMNVAMEKGFKLDEYVKKLEEEKRKIETCELELPLSLQILNDAISYVEEKKRCSEMNTQPLLKDFMSLNKPIREEDGFDKREELMREKKFQLWEANDHISSRSFSDPKIKNKFEIERNEENPSYDGLSMLLIPGMRTPNVETVLGLSLTSSSMVNEGRKGVVNSVPQPPPFLQQQALRKQRRCWTPALHRRFVDALQQLGGAGVATPKQIREHMQEEGLTNDEVKSHLQKYRLHIRNLNPEKQSVVVLGFNLRNSSEEEEGEGEGEGSSKRSNSQSDSPQGPLQLPCTTTTTGGDSSMEDAEDSKSESFQMERLRSP